MPHLTRVRGLKEINKQKAQEKRFKMIPLTDEREIQKILDFVRANQQFEGLNPTAEDMKNARDVLTGKRKGDDVVAELVRQYTKPLTI